MVDLEVDTGDGVSGEKKRFLGVSKVKNRWVARVRNPMLRVDVRLGSYRTPEEAALAVQKKKAEFDEMLKAEDMSSMGTCRGYFKGKKLPSGVLWDNGRYRVQIWHPKLKKLVSGGSYKTCEEAADAANRKREELREMYGGVLKKPESLVAKSDCSEEQTGDVKVLPGIRRIKSGKWGVRIRKPDSKTRISLGTYSTLEEAIGSFNKNKAEFDAKLKKPEFDWVEFKPGSEADETPMKFEYDWPLPTPLSGAPNLKFFALCDKSSYDCGLVEMSPPSGFDPKNLNSAPGSGSDRSCDSDFDRAVSLGIINDYGQLLGKYSEIDKHRGIKLA